MCEGLARCVLVVFNIIFLIFGVICLGVGIWVKVDQSDVIKLFRVASEKTDLDTNGYDVPSLLESGAYILIAVGAIVFVIAFFGFCGAAKRSKCCLMTYGALVGLVLVIQIAAGILVAVYKGQFDDAAHKALNKTLPDVYDGPYHKGVPVSLALDVLQSQESCCGVNGPGDYTTMTWKKFNRTLPDTTKQAEVPFTCCKSSKTESYPDSMNDYIKNLDDKNCPIDGKTAYKKGCYDELKDLLQTYYKAILGVALGVALLEFILIVVACCIACRNKEDFQV